MKIETLPIDDVHEYEHNPRTISDEAVTAVANAIVQFGFRVPVLIDADNVLIAGHTRVRAARKLGHTTVPAIRADDLTPEQVRAFRIADNQLASLTTWDIALLPVELTALQALDFDLATLGFPPAELERLLGATPNTGLTDPDDIPEPPETPVTKPGDLWVLGNHRLLCGDSASQADVDRLLDGAEIHLANLDPPYGVKVEPRSNNAIAAGNSSFTAPVRKKSNTHHQKFDLKRHPEKSKPTTKRMRAKDRPLENDFLSDEEFLKLLDAWFGNIARVLLPGRAIYIWGGYSNVGNYPPVLKRHGLYFSQAIIWHKQHAVLSRKDFMGDHEWCFYGWREGAAHEFYGPNNETDVWSIKKINPQAMVHLTEKPVELAARAIQYSSQPGENVLDLFGGSGSTMIACEQLGRRCFMMEIDPLYADVIRTRWESFSGKKAELVSPRPAPGNAVAEEKARKSRAKKVKA